MSIRVAMPALSPTKEAGTLAGGSGKARWSQPKVMIAAVSFAPCSIDGAIHAAFLARFKPLVEHPLSALA